LRFHETPSEVARLLARHVTRSVRTVLDPAVGQGALLLPILSRLGHGASVVCVDTNPGALAIARKKLTGEVRFLDCVHGDFLEAVLSSPKLRSRTFDCVVMNPPYGAKRAEWLECDLSSLGSASRMFLPKELAFAFRAVERLNDGGRLLAVMPGSMVASGVLSRFRECLAVAGKFHYVHELPKFTFPGVEGRVYLVVFEKGRTSSQIELRNHDLLQPHCLRVSWNDLGKDRRLDFGYHHSLRWLAKLIAAHPKLGWRPLCELIEIRRGPRDSPRGPRVALHTTDCRAGLWRLHTRHLESGTKSRIAPTDLFVARVGRACLGTLGPVVGFRPVSWSDCVFRLRPHSEAIESLPLLLILRVVTGMPAVSQMIERGVGATYITEEELGAIQLPTQLGDACPKLAASYSIAAKAEDAAKMRMLEIQARSYLVRPIGEME
jgi:predicted RNA methylase